MSRIDEKFKQLKKQRKKAFIPFIMAGDPDLSTTEKLIFELEKNKADIIELGVPFSDPLADGPVIQHSSERALRNKININDVCNLVKSARLQTQIPIVFLIYYNLIHHYGLENFIKSSVSAGVDGVVVPDLPPEESYDLRKAAKKNKFAVIHLLAPTSPEGRIIKIAKASTGFIYYVSLTGTTGIRKSLPKEIAENLKKIKKVTKKPICAGFGISTPEQVKEISKSCDGVIVGSAIIKIIEANIGKKDISKKTGTFIRKLSSGLT